MKAKIHIISKILQIAMLLGAVSCAYLTLQRLPLMESSNAKSQQLQKVVRDMLLCGLAGNDVQFARTTDEFEAVKLAYGTAYRNLDNNLITFKKLLRKDELNETTDNACERIKKIDHVVSKLITYLAEPTDNQMSKIQVVISALQKVEKEVDKVIEILSYLSDKIEKDAKRDAAVTKQLALLTLLFNCFGGCFILCSAFLARK